MLKRNDLFCTAVIAAFALASAAAPVAAKGGSSNAKVKPTVRVASAKAATTPKAQTPKVKATGTTKTKASSPKVSSKPAPAKGGPKSSANTAENKPNKPGVTNPTATGPTVPLNKAQQLLMKNDNLRLKLQTRLGGLDPVAQAAGFRNLGQFVAAVNVSFNNPGVSFTALKALMTGTPPMSLGQALQKLRGLQPAVATTTANAALAQADADILTSTTVVRKTNGKK